MDPDVRGNPRCSGGIAGDSKALRLATGQIVEQPRRPQLPHAPSRDPREEAHREGP